jgi:hypothetical protein
VAEPFMRPAHSVKAPQPLCHLVPIAHVGDARENLENQRRSIACTTEHYRRWGVTHPAQPVNPVLLRWPWDAELLTSFARANEAGQSLSGELLVRVLEPADDDPLPRLIVLDN